MSEAEAVSRAPATAEAVAASEASATHADGTSEADAASGARATLEAAAASEADPTVQADVAPGAGSPGADTTAETGATPEAPEAQGRALGVFEPVSESAAEPNQADRMLRKTVAAVLQSEAVADAVGSVIHHLWPRLLTLDPADLTSRLRVGDLKRVEATLFTIYERVVTNVPPGTVVKLPVAAHIGQHVKSLPLPVVEKQLRGVLDRELRSITLMGLWLGLVVVGLGFLVQLILNR